MYTQAEELEIARRFARFVLAVTLTAAALFLVVGTTVAMLAH